MHVYRFHLGVSFRVHMPVLTCRAQVPIKLHSFKYIVLSPSHTLTSRCRHLVSGLQILPHKDTLDVHDTSRGLLTETCPTESAHSGTPLAPSVEKAYYRKCIELKRRLNEVETANDEARIRRQRLDRGIMKMRLERAFLLDELRKRMPHDVDGSDGSADEGMPSVRTSSLRFTRSVLTTAATDRTSTQRQA